MSARLAYVGSSVFARCTFRSATSCCAVRAIFAEGSTRGEQPRDNCAARRPDNTANSNVLMSLGRLIMAAALPRAANERAEATSRPHTQQSFGEGSGRDGRKAQKSRD